MIIQTAKIGDLICSTPVLRAIKKKYPDAHLSALINPTVGKLLEYNPYINETVFLDNGFYKGFTGKMRLTKLFHKGRYDIVVSLNPNVPFTLAMFWALIPVKISLMPDSVGITYRLASVFSTYLERHVRGRLVAETYMEMLKAIGIDDNDISKDVFKSPDADEKVAILLTSNLESQSSKLIGIAVTSGNRLKEWGVDNMAGLINKLVSELNAYIVLIGSEKDQDVADKILKSTMHRDKVINTVGMFTLSELPALIEKLSLFIGVDTGVTYIADALGVPLIDIAGPSDMEDQRPTGKNSYILQKKELGCVPCSHAFDAPYECRYGHRECITRISVEEVFGLASQIMVKI